MAVERYGSKTDVVVKLVLVFFISLLSFSIGTFVGKKFSDNQHKLSQLEPTSDTSMASHMEESSGMKGEERGVASIPPDSHEIKPNEALSDEEIAKLAEEFVSDDEGAPKKENKLNDKNGSGHVEAKAEAEGETTLPASGHPAVTAHAAEPAKGAAHAAPVAHAPVAAAPTAHTTAPMPSAMQVAQGRAPAETKPASANLNRIPSSLPKEQAASAAGKFTVQVASYAKEDEAKNMATDLKNKGFSAFYIPAKVKGDTWFRVSVGLFTTKKEAQAYRDDLLARAKVSSAIVQPINP